MLYLLSLILFIYYLNTSYDILNNHKTDIDFCCKSLIFIFLIYIIYSCCLSNYKLEKFDNTDNIEPENINETFLEHLTTDTITIDKKSAYGGSGGGPFDKQCPDNSYVTSVNVKTGSALDSIGFSCSDGTKFGPFGGKGGAAHDFNENNGFDNITINAGSLIDAVTLKDVKKGGPGGSPNTVTCTDKIRGFHGRSGAMVDNLGVYCGTITKPTPVTKPVTPTTTKPVSATTKPTTPPVTKCSACQKIVNEWYDKGLYYDTNYLKTECDECSRRVYPQKYDQKSIDKYNSLKCDKKACDEITNKYKKKKWIYDTQNFGECEGCIRETYPRTLEDKYRIPNNTLSF